MNVYVKSVVAKGYKAGSTSTTFYHYIDPMIDARIAIGHYDATGSNSAADKLTFMIDIGTVTSTIASAAALGVSTVVLSADPAPNGAAIAANDHVCIQLATGAYQFTTINTWTSGTKTAILNDALTAAVSAGAKIWCLGVRTDNNHHSVNLTTASTNYKNTGEFLFYGKEKWSPMIVAHQNAGATTGYINSITGCYIDV
jgi:hypothetical protein